MGFIQGDSFFLNDPFPGELNRERTSFAGFGFDVYRTAVRPGDLVGDEKAQAGTPGAL